MATVKVLAGINFSECSLHALRYVINMFDGVDIKLTIAFCYSEMIDAEELQIDLSSIIHDRIEIEKIYKSRLIEIKSNVEKQFPIRSFQIDDTDIKLLFGYPEEQLATLAKAENYDFIVMGLSVGQNTITELMGSVTSDLIRKTAIPFLAVPTLASFDKKEVHDILYLTDFRKSDFDAIHRLIQIFSHQTTIVHCVHFNHNNPDRFDEMRMLELQDYCKETYRNQNVQCENIVGEHLIESLNQFILSKGISLMAVTRIKRNYISRLFHPDFSKQLLFHSHVPLIVFNS